MADGENVGFPSTSAPVDFGWEKPVSSRKRKEESKRKVKPGSFEAMNLDVELMRGVKRKGYRLPTPIQRRAMPLILQGQDVVGMARTGSGKTAAFVIPMIQRLKVHSMRAGARAVILSPSRELALQTHKVVKELGRYTDLRTAVLVGGDSMEAQFAELAGNPDVLVATPGRLMHHLEEVQAMSLKTAEYVVFDEADRLFEMGFADQLRAVLGSMSESRQTLLFSATMPKALAEFARAGLRDPELVRLDTDSKLSPDLSLAFFTVRPEDKLAAFMHAVQEVVPTGQPTIIFASTRHHVELLSQLLRADGVPSAHVYGTMDQSARKISIAKFRAGKVQFLVVTDVAARGIDIPLLDNVINYDFPPQPKLFVHRVGRAARAGRVGMAYSLVSRDELPYLLDLHLFLSRPLRPADVQSIATAAAADAPEADTSLYGSFPQVCLETSGEHVRELISNSSDLTAQLRYATNAFKLYRKTRPGAAPESVKRAKMLPREGIHPLLAASVPSRALGGLEAVSGLAAITDALKSYRPAQTVLEAEVSRGRGPIIGGSAAAPSDVLGRMMLAKRQAHSGTIVAAKQRKIHLQAMALASAAEPAEGLDSDDGASSASEGEEGDDSRGGSLGAGPSQFESRRRAASTAMALGDGIGADGRFRDKDFFINLARDDRHEEAGYSVRGTGGDLDAAVMDLTGEEAKDMKSAQGRFHWDKRHKRYVQLQPDEKLRGTGKRKTESGGVVKGELNKTGLYEKWAKQQKRRIAAPGELEKGNSFDPSLSNRFLKGGRGWANPAKTTPAGKGADGKGVREELRAPQQVRKEKQKAERRREHSNAAKRGGGSGGPGERSPMAKKQGRSTHGPPLAARGGGVSKRGGRGVGTKGAAPKRQFKGDKAGRTGRR